MKFTHSVLVHNYEVVKKYFTLDPETLCKYVLLMTQGSALYWFRSTDKVLIGDIFLKIHWQGVDRGYLFDRSNQNFLNKTMLLCTHIIGIDTHFLIFCILIHISWCFVFWFTFLDILYFDTHFLIFCILIHISWYFVFWYKFLMYCILIHISWYFVFWNYITPLFWISAPFSHNVLNSLLLYSNRGLFNSLWHNTKF